MRRRGEGRPRAVSAILGAAGRAARTAAGAAAAGAGLRSRATAFSKLPPLRISASNALRDGAAGADAVAPAASAAVGAAGAAEGTAAGAAAGAAAGGTSGSASSTSCAESPSGSCTTTDSPRPPAARPCAVRRSLTRHFDEAFLAPVERGERRLLQRRGGQLLLRAAAGLRGARRQLAAQRAHLLQCCLGDVERLVALRSHSLAVFALAEADAWACGGRRTLALARPRRHVAQLLGGLQKVGLLPAPLWPLPRHELLCTGGCSHRC